MSDWIIRPALEADLEAIMAIEHECFPEDAWSKDNMHFELLAHHTEYLVAVRDERVIGYAGLSKVPASDQGDIQTIAVLPAARGLGLGRALMDALIAAARRSGTRVRAHRHPQKLLPAGRHRCLDHAPRVAAAQRWSRACGSGHRIDL
jgi:ribosomal protein S18 acetylase RimI-like enzyme